MKHARVPNSLGVECIADEIRVATDESALAAQVRELDAGGTPLTIIGGGSNLVLRGRLPGAAILVRLRGITVERLDGPSWRVTAAAGEDWQSLVDATLGRGIGGLENLTLIPGSVGAAPVQNIGAYGRELSDVLESVTVFDRRQGVLATLPAADCGLGYRDSHFKRDVGDRLIIVRIALRLGGTGLVTDYPDVARELAHEQGAVDHRRVADVVAGVRRRKLPDPERIGNVGSFFKNPVVTRRHLDDIRSRIEIDDYPSPAPGDGRKIPAARLIDQAGWKGFRDGPVEVWPRQPLVLVNRGGATGAQVLDLAERVREDVHSKYGVALELEPTVKGIDP